MKDFLTAPELAKIERVHRMTVIRWIRKGFFPNARVVGRTFRVPVDDYAKWRERTQLNVRTNVHPDERTSERT